MPPSPTRADLITDSFASARLLIAGRGLNSLTGVPTFRPSMGMRHSFRSFVVTAGSLGVPVVGVPLITTGSTLSMPALVRE